jgi:hypothetical protein
MDIFIPDETVLHLLVWLYGVESHSIGYPLKLAEGGTWNCSPKYQPERLSDDQVVIRHYHGHSNVRPNKSQKGFDLWWPIFQQCLGENVGGMFDWIDQIEN